MVLLAVLVTALQYLIGDAHGTCDCGSGMPDIQYGSSPKRCMADSEHLPRRSIDTNSM